MEQHIHNNGCCHYHSNRRRRRVSMYTYHTIHLQWLIEVTDAIATQRRITYGKYSHNDAWYDRWGDKIHIITSSIWFTLDLLIHSTDLYIDPVCIGLRLASGWLNGPGWMNLQTISSVQPWWGFLASVFVSSRHGSAKIDNLTTECNNVKMLFTTYGTQLVWSTNTHKHTLLLVGQRIRSL